MILKSFSRESYNLGVSEFASTLNLPKSVVHEDLVALVEEGILEKDEKTSKYSLGVEIFHMGQLVHSQMILRQCGLPIMENLSRITGETVILAGLVKGSPCCIEKIPSSHDLSLSVDIGTWYPLHAGTVGKTLLAFQKEEERNKIIEGLELVRFTENTIMDKSELRKRLMEILERGYDLSIEERVKGVASVGAPVKNHRGEAVAVLILGGPTVRFTTERIDQYISLVKEGAQEISKKMGSLSS
jgi:DNA-binding IclR family transcriptional regulator